MGLVFTPLEITGNFMQVLITGYAADTSGATLDGNQGDNPDGDKDGEPGGDYVFSFKTRPPEFELELEPYFAKIKINERQTIKVLLTNFESRELDIELERPSHATSNWHIYGVSHDTVIVPPLETSSEATFRVQNLGEPGTIVSDVIAKCYDEEKEASFCVWAYSPNQQYSEPFPPPVGCDENYSISSHMFPSPWILNPHAKTGIFLSGYAECMGHLLGKFNISTAIVLDNFTILGAHERPLSDLDVLIIPTGGLIPYANLPFYRDKFAEFVDQGGTLVCYAQSEGEVFEGLPGSPTGYGWLQDQSCHPYACYLNLWDTFLAGQDNVVYDGCNLALTWS